MELTEAVDVAKQIEKDLQKYANDPKVSKSIINGSGFRSLDFSKDFLKCLIPKENLKYFLDDYLKSIHIKSKIKKQLK